MNNTTNFIRTTECLQLHGTDMPLDISLKDSSQMVHVNVISTCVMASLICVCAVFLNLSVLITVWREETLQSCSNVLLASLALNDFFVASTSQPAHILYYASSLQNQHPGCVIEAFYVLTAQIFIGASFWTLFLISADRFIALFFPFRYTMWVTIKRTLLGVTVIWLMRIILVFLPMVGLSKTAKTLGFVATIFFVSCILVFYVKIFCLAKKHKLQVLNQMQNTEARLVHAQDSRAAKTVFLVIAALVLSYVPIGIIVLVETAGPTILSRYVLIPWATLCMYVSSCVNAMIYVLRNENLRKGVIKTWRSCCG